MDIKRIVRKNTIPIRIRGLNIPDPGHFLSENLKKTKRIGSKAMPIWIRELNDTRSASLLEGGVDIILIVRKKKLIRIQNTAVGGGDYKVGREKKK